MKNITAIVLAAGRGTRMKSDTPKVMHEVMGKPMIVHVLENLRSAGVDDVIVVAGFGSDKVKSAARGAKVVIQKKLLGSGDAVQTARNGLKRIPGNLLVICGDTPLIRPETIKCLIDTHIKTGSSATLLTVNLEDPTGYGRIVRESDGSVSAIVEELEAAPYEKAITEINVGTYCFKAADLFDALEDVKPDNSKGEFFLTDTIAIFNERGKRVSAVVTDDFNETIGVNTRNDLAEATRIMKNRILDKLMAEGVTIIDPTTTMIHPEVKIGKETVVYPNTIIEPDVVIGDGCALGPFARIRPGVRLGDFSEVGNFVELVRTSVGKRTKIKHHTYLGDAVIGSDVNIGAGVITANFDGKDKHQTVIEDKVFIGIGARLIAPVRIGKGAFVGAGSVVLKEHNVAPGSTVVGVPARVLHTKKR